MSTDIFEFDYVGKGNYENENINFPKNLWYVDTRQ